MKIINIELATEKGLIINNDYKNYDHILKLYRKGLDIILDNIVNFKEIDTRIENSGLYFAPSTTLFNSERNINNNTNYFACLNPLFIEKLDTSYINILIQKKDVDQEVLNIILKTLKEIITKDGVNKVCYSPPMPKHIVENGTIVLEFIYGKNEKTTKDEEFLKINKTQKEFIDEMTNYISHKIKNKLNINTKIFVNKAI